MARQRRVAAVGYRIGKTGGPEFLLVRTSAGDRWTFPKGGLEADDATAAQGAQREASEEAGVSGVVDPILLCTYTHLAHLGGDYYREQTVEAFLLRVTHCDDEVAEPGRQPTWSDPEGATAALAENQLAPAYADELRRVVEAALDRLDTITVTRSGATSG